MHNRCEPECPVQFAVSALDSNVDRSLEPACALRRREELLLQIRNMVEGFDANVLGLKGSLPMRFAIDLLRLQPHLKVALMRSYFGMNQLGNQNDFARQGDDKPERQHIVVFGRVEMIWP
ncbi:lipase/esterase [Pseudozyma hubeiensis SY62]|uniref:Lipase/esterase n=1 Tax=Pseudozyma hubeiensis (strain SY62) TaxID=1305764 RepID=R9P8P3_PSEHS|nr:lipase/esterase [Pseudozyma hubeiensis SY62]GAC94450.1 lipase/esterase [Pseudozyma hubeiensis SY62]